jgi:hypothetical protein
MRLPGQGTEQQRPRASARRGRFRRARRAVCWGLAAFAAAQAALALALTRWAPELRDPAYGIKARQLQHRLRRAESPPDLVVMLGSSRVAYGLRGEQLEAELGRELGRPVVVYNLGRLGGGPIAECVYLHRLLAEGPRPRLVFLEFIPHMMTRAGTTSELESLRVGPLGPDDAALLERFGAEEGGPPWWLARGVPVWAYRRAFLYRFAPRLLTREVRAHCQLQWWQGLSPSGWQARESKGPREEAERAHLAWVRPLLDELEATPFGPEVPGCRAFEDTLELARAEGVPVVLVLLPEAPSLRRLYPAGSWARARRYLEGLGARYGCPLVDAREWVPADDFADPDHLAPPGARLFTERLGREVLRRSLVPGP